MKKQVFIRYEHWECYKSGLYKQSRATLEMVNKCAKVLCNPQIFENSINRVQSEWPISYSVHMTNIGINRRAYLGAVACCIAFGASEEVVRIAWKLLPIDAQQKANEIAQAHIDSFDLTQIDQSTQLKLFTND